MSTFSVKRLHKPQIGREGEVKGKG